MKILRKLFKTFWYLIKIIGCMAFDLFVPIGLVPSYIGKSFWEIALYFTLLIVVMVGIWVVAFAKNKKIIPIYILLFVLLLYLPLILPSMKNASRRTDCLGSGICKEGIKTKNDQGVLFEVNKQNCLKYNYRWDEKRKSCNLRANQN